MPRFRLPGASRIGVPRLTEQGILADRLDSGGLIVRQFAELTRGGPL